MRRSGNISDLSGRRVLVVGLGRSGLAAARFLASRGAEVTVNDRRERAALESTLAGLPGNANVVLGEHPEDLFTGSDLVVVSPGVGTLPALEAARGASVEVIGEIELAARHLQAEVIAITGTNGKSTTTTWIGEMLKETGRPLFVGGNLGRPLIEAVDSPAGGAEGICVVELSSFQLETVSSLAPRVAVLLNLAQDHLDRYRDLQAYGAAKGRIFSAQRREDWAVVNWDQPACRELASGGAARVAGFSLSEDVTPGAGLRHGRIEVRLPEETRSFDASDLSLVGRHNLENALAASLAATLVGAGQDQVQKSLVSFRGLPHRMEYVGELRGVRFYNDSKATNVSAVMGSLGGFPHPFVLVAGGRHKGAPYEPLRQVLKGHARALVLLGEAADQMEAELVGVAPIHRARSLEDAVALAASLAGPSEAVVLSPACSSYDMFTDFEERGMAFAEAVANLREDA